MPTMAAFPLKVIAAPPFYARPLAAIEQYGLKRRVCQVSARTRDAVPTPIDFNKAYCVYRADYPSTR